jgi:hypothetical protein
MHFFACAWDANLTNPRRGVRTNLTPQTSAESDVNDWRWVSASATPADSRLGSKRDSKKPADRGSETNQQTVCGGPIVTKIVEAEEKIHEAEQKIAELERRVVESLRKIKRPYEKFKNECEKAATTAKVLAGCRLGVFADKTLGNCDGMLWQHEHHL